MHLLCTSDEFRYPKIGFQVLKVPWSNALKASWRRIFFIFWQIFTIFDDLSKWSTPNALQGTFEKSSKMEKMLVQLAFNQILGMCSGIRFRHYYALHHVHIYLVMIYFDFYLYNFVITLFALSDIKETSKKSRSNTLKKPTFGCAKYVP